MDAEAAAALGDVDDPGDEVGHLLDEGGELVDDDDERWRCFVRVALDHLGEVFGFALHQSHPVVELGAQRGEGAQRQRRLEVGDVADRVRDVVEDDAGCPALVVDEQERQAGRRVLVDQGGDDRLQQFALAGTGRAADQGVRAVLDEVELERTGRTDADRGAQAVRLGLRPLPGDRQRGGQLRSEQREQRHDARDRCGRAGRRGVAQRGERHGDLIDQAGVGRLQFEVLGRDLGICEPHRGQRQRAADLGNAAHRRLRLAGNAGIGLDRCDDGDPGLRAQVEEL